MSTKTPEVRGIDPRGPRFSAAITSVLLAAAFVLALMGISTLRWEEASFGWLAGEEISGPWVLPAAPLWVRVTDPGFLAVAITAVLFAWGVLSPRTAPWNALFARFVRPRLSPILDSEDPRPPRFSQGVGLAVTGLGLLLHLIGVPWALPIAAAMAFVAAFLNAAIGFCLGCQLWLLLQRVGVVGRASA